MTDSSFYVFVLLPFLIFLARVADVSLGTIRVIFISKGFKYLAACTGFFEVLIWIIAMGQIINNLTNPICYLAYAGGFAMGNFVGIRIIEKLSLGMVMLRVVTQNDIRDLLVALANAEYGVTKVDAEGAKGKVNILFTIIPRKELNRAVTIIKSFNPHAFYSIEEVGHVDKGIFPIRRSWKSGIFGSISMLFRKGK